MPVRPWFRSGRVAAASLAGVGLVLAQSAFAQKWPERPIRLIVPFVVGGSYDPVARVVSHYLSEDFGQQIIVDNRPGASGMIGADILARSNPDGYTIGMLGNNHTIISALRDKIPYDLLKDFAPISRVGVVDNAVVVHPSVPAKTLAEFVALARANPGKFNYGSGGAAGTTHFGGELFNSLAGTKVVHVPYKGGGSAVAGIVAGEVHMMVMNMINADPHMRNGRLRGLAIAAKQRHPLAPNMPTTAEAGLPGLEMSQWYGVLTPVRTPKTVLATLGGALQKLSGREDARAKMATQGIAMYFESPGEFAKFLREDIELYRRVGREANIRPD
jgi:tripartite-type tricarboxylate transporter receptor subunit TctC